MIQIFDLENLFKVIENFLFVNSFLVKFVYVWVKGEIYFLDKSFF